MLMQLGPFRFDVPTYSVEDIKRSVSSRVAVQDVIGGAPATHLLGPGDETQTLSSTFFPYHLNGGGLLQLEGVRAACQRQTPLMMVSLSGFVFGRWIITEVGDNQSIFGVGGVPQKITVQMSLLRYVGRGNRFGLF